MNQLCQQGVKVILCRDMDVCYDVEERCTFDLQRSMWSPRNGYTNVSCRDMEAVEGVVSSFVKSDESVFGLTVHPSQYYGVCKVLQGFG